MTNLKKVLRKRCDLAVLDLYQVAQNHDVEKFQWYRGYITAMSLAIELIDSYGYGGDEDENERHTHEEI